MTAFLKIDTCSGCLRNASWEWIPPLALAGKPLAGTGVWRSQLSEGRCPECVENAERARRNKQHAAVVQTNLVQLLGGTKPSREFTFERFEVSSGNRLAHRRASEFNPLKDNLYLWGRCGVGKTHLADAIARRFFQEQRTVALLTPAKLSRKLRMKDPAQEQDTLNDFVHVTVFVLDDLGMGNETLFTKQVLQEILDGRDYDDRAGLVITSKYSLDDLAQKLADDTIPSRLAGMCEIVRVSGDDRRIESSGHQRGVG